MSQKAIAGIAVVVSTILGIDHVPPVSLVAIAIINRMLSARTNMVAPIVITGFMTLTPMLTGLLAAPVSIVLDATGGYAYVANATGDSISGSAWATVKIVSRAGALSLT